ncbi:MAG: TetR/AcrR family transcriptional regulator [Eubacteriales bacterium]
MTEVTMRERKKEATKTNILNVAIDLINQYGFAETTMQLVAEKADVALRTLYNYFPSKESIVATYVRNVVKAEEEKSWNELVELDTTYERLVLVCRKTSEWSTENLVLTEIYAADPRNYFYANRDNVPRSGIDELVAKIMEMGQRMGDVILSVDVEVLVRQFIGVFYLSVLTWLSDPAQDLFGIFKDGLDVLYRGIMAQGAEPETVLRAMFC